MAEAQTDNKDKKRRYKEALFWTWEITTLNAFPMQFHSAGGLCDASWIGYNCIKISVWKLCLFYYNSPIQNFDVQVKINIFLINQVTTNA